MVEAHSLPQSPTSGKHAKDTLELALSAKYFSCQDLKMHNETGEEMKHLETLPPLCLMVITGEM